MPLINYYIAATFLAYMVKGLTGFASSLTFNTILSFRLANREITPLDLLLGIPANAVMAWRERRGIKPRVVAPLCALVFFGLVPGTLFLAIGDQRLLKIILGLLVIALCAQMLLDFKKTEGKPAKGRKPMLAAIGIVSGILTGLFGIGAFLTAYISRTTESQSQFKANICCVFLFEGICRIILYIIAGLMSAELLFTALPLMPVMVLGLCAGFFAAKKLKEETVRKCVVVLLIAAGFSLIIHNLLI